MNRVALVLLACVAACSIYGSDDDDDAPSTPTPADASTPSASDAATLDESDLTNDPSLANEAGAEPDATSSSTDAAPDTGGPALPDLLVFLSSSQHTGKLSAVGSEVAGDQICQTLGVGYPNKKWVAWLSGPTGNVKERIVDKAIGRAYRRIDHALVIEKAEMILDHPLDAPIILDEKGIPWGPQVYVWTGTSLGGQLSASSCLGWYSSESTATGISAVTSASADWGTGNVDSCDKPRHLYCFEVP